MAMSCTGAWKAEVGQEEKGLLLRRGLSARQWHGWDDSSSVQPGCKSRTEAPHPTHAELWGHRSSPSLAAGETGLSPQRPTGTAGVSSLARTTMKLSLVPGPSTDTSPTTCPHRHRPCVRWGSAPHRGGGRGWWQEQGEGGSCPTSPRGSSCFLVSLPLLRALQHNAAPQKPQMNPRSSAIWFL